jgi:hypothetical protein
MRFKLAEAVESALEAPPSSFSAPSIKAAMQRLLEDGPSAEEELIEAKQELAVAKSQKRKRGDKLAAAMAIKSRHPEWTASQVAAAAKCAPSLLSRKEYEDHVTTVEREARLKSPLANRK